MVPAMLVNMNWTSHLVKESTNGKTVKVMRVNGSTDSLKAKVLKSYPMVQSSMVCGREDFQKV